MTTGCKKIPLCGALFGWRNAQGCAGAAKHRDARERRPGGIVPGVPARQRMVDGPVDWQPSPTQSRAVKEYLDTLDHDPAAEESVYHRSDGTVGGR